MVNEPVHYHLGEFPPANIDWQQLIPLLGPAHSAISKYDGLLSAVPDAGILLSPLTTQEAVLSSKIEGTNISMSEVLEIESGATDKVSNQKYTDAGEVINYRLALLGAANGLKDRGVSLHLLRETHQRLMQGVRGVDMDPGNFRTEQNWVGDPGCEISEANFIPIIPEHLMPGLETWMAFLQDKTQPDPLVQLAVLHLEFEALHPFKDGNGRLGRILIPLFLAWRGLLSSPNFYMSGYLEARRDEYISKMRLVSKTGDWTDWCRFFLIGVKEQASENQRRALEILELYKSMIDHVARLTRSQYASAMVNYIFNRPIFSASHFVQEAQIPRATAMRFLPVLHKNTILHRLRKGAGRQPAIYAFPELINIAEGRRIV